MLTKICQLDGASPVHQDIGPLDITMHDLLIVKIGKPANDLFGVDTNHTLLYGQTQNDAGQACIMLAVSKTSRCYVRALVACIFSLGGDPSVPSFHVAVEFQGSLALYLKIV